MLSESGVIEELADIFKQYRERFTLLRSIDQQTLCDKGAIDDFLLSIRQNLRVIFRATHAGVYAVTDEKRLPLVAECDDTWPKIDSETPLPEQLSESQPIGSFENWPRQEDPPSLMIRVDVSKNLYILLLLTDELVKVGSPITSNDALDLAQQIRDQLGVFINHRLLERKQHLQRDLLESFFKNQLKPRICWSALVGHIERYLPDWYPMRLPDESRAQLLTYHTSGKYLLLRASHRSEKRDKVPPFEKMERIPGPNPVHVDRSICGLAVKMAKFPFYINPCTKYTDQYAAYLWGTNIPESELVLPIYNEGKLFAVLNIENMFPKAFLSYHIEVLYELCEFLSPLLWTLINREDRQWIKEMGAQYTIGRMLRRMSQTYHHFTGHSFLKINGALNKLEGFKHKLDDEAKEQLNALTDRLAELQDRSDNFLVGIDEYILNRRVDIVQHLKKARNAFVPDPLQTSQSISFSLNAPDETLFVFASELLSEHFYNVLHNSFTAVTDAIEKGQIGKGFIRIYVERAEMPDCRNKRTAPARIYIKVEDNGGGVAPEYYDHILEFRFTTRRLQGGSGFGLSAAREYFQSKGGGLSTENHFGRGLTVIMYLQEYTPEYHDSQLLTGTSQDEGEEYG
jgi:signal transduction histidine kinase